MLALLVMGVSNVFAQNVTIGPNNGSLVTGQAGGNTDDSGIKRGMSSLWRHEQLPLSMTTSDIANLTSAGELADPSCAIDVYNGNLILGAGQTQTFVVVSLPKGYRITGYKLVLQPNVYGNGIQLHSGKNSWDIGEDDTMCFYETPAWNTGSPYGENTHSNQLTCPDAIATATASDGRTTEMQNNNAENRAKEFTIERTAKQNADGSYDMTNQLHFFFAAATSARDQGRTRNTPYQYAVTIKSFMIYFTAEGTFDVEVTPVAVGTATDYVKSPFATSKMDLGAVNNTNNLYTYDYTGVRDIKAQMHLYQDNAYSTAGVPVNKTGANDPKNIYPLEIDGKGVYAFGNDTYFIEPPVEVFTQTGAAAPIGFRVVGAKFNCQYGTATSAQPINIPAGITISYGNHTKYYLNNHLDFVSTNDPFVWHEDEYGNIYTGSVENKVVDGKTVEVDNRQYLACFGDSEEERILSFSTAVTGAEAKWNLRIDSDNHLYYTDSQNHKFILNSRTIQEGSDNHNRGYLTVGASLNVASAATTGGTTTKTIPAFNPGSYTLTAYKADGETVAFTKTVNSAADEEVIPLTGLNNDALKFTISGLTSYTNDKGETINPQALVTVTLQLQALNPYIDNMKLVCENTPKEFQMSQTFTASDFRVSGGKFVFYIPKENEDDIMTFKFDNLYSHYGDNTYYDMTGTFNSRYSFVTSDYFTGNKGKNLYAATYDPDADYKTKVVTSTAGNIRFKFNNAEDLTAGGSGTKYLQEYLFDYDKYIGSEDPDTDEDGNPTGKTGNYIQCQLQASAKTEGYAKEGTFYVFTADETRYNIAPTTAWQHRSYAFYRMDIELQAKNFTPQLTWKELYKKTFYTGDGTTPLEKSMWGVKINTNPDDNGKQGYITLKRMMDAIDARTKDDVAAPKELDQILFVDGSELFAIIESKDAKFKDVEGHLGKNLLVFLPINNTSNLDNFAYLTSVADDGTKSFRAGNDIVITDKNPFFTPYDIQVDPAHYMEYSRAITPADGYSNVVNASILLPFTINMGTSGEYQSKDEDGKNLGSPFKLATMNKDKALSKKVEEYKNDTKGYFTHITGSSEANKPYIVTVMGKQNDKFNFHVRANGSTVKATGNPYATDYNSATSGVCEGTASTGYVDDVKYYLTPKGTFMGKEVMNASAASPAIFYFSKDCFVTTRTLGAGKSLKILPFRSYYEYPEPVASTSGAKMTSFRIVFGENNELDGTTGIDDVRKDADLAVIPGKGTITLMARVEKDVTIHAVNGITVDKCSLNAGETRTVAVPAGVYVINGVKMVVK